MERPFRRTVAWRPGLQGLALLPVQFETELHEPQSAHIPSSAFVPAEDVQTWIGKKRVGTGPLDVGDDTTRVDLCCLGGTSRRNVPKMQSLQALANKVASTDGATSCPG